jgi:MOSC domain-containing protein YiiM
MALGHNKDVSLPSAIVEAVFVGQPRQITDRRGTRASSIQRERIDGPVLVSVNGLAGDRVTQPYHGGPGAAVCVHLTDHYDFWNRSYGMHLAAGSVGENVTLRGISEDRVFIGDVVRLGTALVQVSGPRVPCMNQARHIGRDDWVRLTIRENRTGFYLRVLEPGHIQEGDSWRIENRLNQDASIPAINHCMYVEFDPDFASRMLSFEGLEPWWKEQVEEKLELPADHWTNNVAAESDSNP